MEELQTQLDAGLHTSASLTVYSHGKKLIDTVSGSPVNIYGDPIQHDLELPLYRAFSCGKALVAATIWRLIDAGIVEIDEPIAQCWPEFAQRGKTTVTLRHALTHTSGLPFEPAPIEWPDWGRVTDIIAGLPLESEPGKIIQYHALTFGWIVGEIASRASGLSFDEVFEREVKTPLRLEDTFFSIHPDDRSTLRRVTNIRSSSDYSVPNMPENMDWLLKHEISAPGGTCVTSSSDLARLYATVSNDGVTTDGDRWISSEAASNVYRIHKHGYDIEDMTEKLVGQGVWLSVGDLDRAAAPIESKTFGHGGMATSIAWGDPEHSIGIAFLTDKMIPEDQNICRLNRISAAVRHDLGIPVGEVAEMP